MARPSTTVALLFLLSLLAVAHCRPLEENLTDAEPAAVVEAGGDENGPPNTTPPANVVLPAEQQQHGFLRLPSHRLRPHRPCHLLRHHLWWARHHGAFGNAPRRFHRHVEVLRHLPVLPADETVEAGEVKPVEEPSPEPEPDHSLADSDGEVEVARREPSFGDADGAYEGAHEDEGAAVRAWRREMQRRWFHHHGMRIHRHHYDDEEEAAEGLKRFHHAIAEHDDEDEAEKGMMRKRFRHAIAEHDDDEDEEVEEVVRRFRKAIMRRRFGHGRRFHHHHRHYGHRHAEDAEKADAPEEGGVVSWIKGLMNRF